MRQKHCRRCGHVFVPRPSWSRHCGCQPAYVLVECSECRDVFQSARRGRSGRPRKTCDVACAMKRNRRIATERLQADTAEATAWWLSLSLGARGAVGAWLKTEPPPSGWTGGKVLWAYFCRSAFTWEQRAASGVW